jgi:hypothetical protein
MLHPHPQSCLLTLNTATRNTSQRTSPLCQVDKTSELPPLSVMIKDATANIRMADMSQSLGKKPTKSLLLWRMPVFNLDVNLVSSQSPIPASHYRQPLKKYRKLFTSCENGGTTWKAFERIDESNTDQETKKAYKHIYTSVSEKYYSHIQLARWLHVREEVLQRQQPFK